jgi:L-asparaginase
MKAKILLIYTGGTIGMIRNKVSNALVPFSLSSLLSAIPELKTYDLIIDHISILKPIDSSDIDISNWIEISGLIEQNYNAYNGFVILHGTDTMAYTASALSFMIENLTKPIILTGSQIPIGARRTDAKDNLITSIEIASSNKINDVCIYFENKLYKGNRTIKTNTEDFDAFESPNFPIIAEVGRDIKYLHLSSKKTKNKLKIYKALSNDVAIIKLFPGIKTETIENIFKTVKAVVIESYGAGNTSTNPKLIDLLNNMVKQNKIIINVTQCMYGKVIKGEYATSKAFSNKEIIHGQDITTEAAITKLMFLLAKNLSDLEIKKQLRQNLRGEFSH